MILIQLGRLLYLQLIEFWFALAVIVEKELALIAAKAPHARNHAALGGHARWLLQRVIIVSMRDGLYRSTRLSRVLGLEAQLS